MNSNDLVKKVINASIPWDKYPSINNMDNYRKRAYLIVYVVEKELGIKYLSASEITLIINKKFRKYKTAPPTIINALNKNIGTEVDTRIVGGITRYFLLTGGKKLFDGAEKTLDQKKLSPEEKKHIRAQKYFSNLDIHPEIQKVSGTLFNDGHYAQAIFEAYKKINNMVKSKSGESGKDGKSLMLHVFSRNNPVLKLNDLKSRSDFDEQEGFMHLYAGAIMGIRNPKGHDEIVQKDPFKTLEYICFASLLAKRLDECKK